MYSDWLKKQRVFKLRGYSYLNPAKNVSIAKQPAVSSWKTQNFVFGEALHSDMQKLVEEGFWLGLVIPDDWTVIDIDEDREDVIEWLKHFPCWIIKTTKGYHIYMKSQDFLPQSQGLIHPTGFKMDVRQGGKGYVVIPNTEYYTFIDNQYQVLHGFIDEEEITHVPLWLAPVKTQPKNQTKLPLEEGNRHNTLLYLGHLVYNTYHDKDFTLKWLLSFNEHCCRPPQEVDDIRHIADDVEVFQDRFTSRRPENIQLAGDFVWDNGRAYYCTENGLFRRLSFSAVADILYPMLKEKLTDSVVRKVELQWETQARLNKGKLHRRHYEANGVHYLNWGNTVLTLSPEMITIDVPLKEHAFLDLEVEFEEPKPTDKTIDELLWFIEGERQRQVLYLYLLSYFLDITPKPSLVIVGAMGNGKTTLARILQMIGMKTLEQQAFTDEAIKEVPLHATFTQNILFDNITNIDKKTANLFCELITGTAIKKRRLFTNDDLVVLKPIANYIFTSLSPKLQADLLSRVLFVYIKKPKQMLSYEDILENINFPELYGRIVEDLRYAFYHKPKIKTYHTRFVKWEEIAVAVCEKHGINFDELMQTMKEEKYFLYLSQKGAVLSLVSYFFNTIPKEKTEDKIIFEITYGQTMNFTAKQLRAIMHEGIFEEYFECRFTEDYERGRPKYHVIFTDEGYRKLQSFYKTAPIDIEEEEEVDDGKWW